MKFTLLQSRGGAPLSGGMKGGSQARNMSGVNHPSSPFFPNTPLSFGPFIRLTQASLDPSRRRGGSFQRRFRSTNTRRAGARVMARFCACVITLTPACTFINNNLIGLGPLPPFLSSLRPASFVSLNSLLVPIYQNPAQPRPTTPPKLHLTRRDERSRSHQWVKMI